jgi:hypothetical protein
MLLLTSVVVTAQTLDRVPGWRSAAAALVCCRSEGGGSSRPRRLEQVLLVTAQQPVASAPPAPSTPHCDAMCGGAPALRDQAFR